MVYTIYIVEVKREDTLETNYAGAFLKLKSAINLVEDCYKINGYTLKPEDWSGSIASRGRQYTTVEVPVQGITYSIFEDLLED